MCMDGLTYMADHLFIENKQKIEGKFIGWDYAHAGDYAGYYGDKEIWKDEKKWTTKEIFEEVKEACYQLKQLEEQNIVENTKNKIEKEFKMRIARAKKERYIEWAKKDFEFALTFLTLSIISLILFFSTKLIVFKALNLFNSVHTFCFFIRSVKEFKKDIKELKKDE